MRSLKTTARTTGFLYLGVGITGMFGFLLIRPEIYVTGDAAATFANLVDREMLARLGIAFELLVVLTQALAAVWFYKLFRTVSSTAAGSLAAFGLINSTAVLCSAAFLVTALATALDPALSPGGDAAGTVQLMYGLSGAFWGVGALFFGLWLIPMGYLAVASRWMPRPLGWILIGGGVGYILSAFVVYLVPDAPGALETALVSLATVGEFWMIGYLLIKGVREDKASPVALQESRGVIGRSARA